MPHSRLSADSQGPARGPMHFGTNIQHTALVHTPPRKQCHSDKTKTRLCHRNMPQDAHPARLNTRYTHGTGTICTHIPTHAVTRARSTAHPQWCQARKSGTCRLPNTTTSDVKTFTMQHQHKQALKLQAKGTGKFAQMPSMQSTAWLSYYTHHPPGAVTPKVPENIYTTAIPTPVTHPMSHHLCICTPCLACTPTLHLPQLQKHALLTRTRTGSSNDAFSSHTIAMPPHIHRNSMTCSCVSQLPRLRHMQCSFLHQHKHACVQMQQPQLGVHIRLHSRTLCVCYTG
jgi:hypothetical protein